MDTPYTYQRLKDPQSIRLIQLLPGSFLDPVHCLISHCKPQSGSSTPYGPYAALSYTWGDPNQATTIFVDGHGLKVTSSLHDALRKLRMSEQSRYLWIDAICINQGDNLERAIQVKLMRQIYASAGFVEIYVGEAANNSEQLPTRFDTLKPIFDTLRDEVPLDADESHKSTSNRVMLSDEETNAAVKAFFDRPWFSRIWVIQEAVMARRSRFLCGSWALLWDDLREIYHWAVARQMPQLIHDYDAPGIFIFLVICSLKSEALGFRFPLLELLQDSRIANATDPRDHVFALLGLSKDPDVPAVQPDYDLPYAELCNNVARYFVTSGQGIQLLYSAVPTTNSSFPSWVPDWTTKLGAVARIDRSSYSAAGNSQGEVRLHKTLPNVLLVQGVHVDTISLVGRTHESSDRSPKGMHSQLIECLDELEAILVTDGRSTYPTGEILEDVLWRAAIGSWPLSREETLGFKLSESFVTDLEGYEAWKDRRDEEQIDPDPPLRPLFHPDSAASKADEFERTARKFCFSRKRCRTHRGYVGHVPRESCVDDIVMIPLGARTPFILRPRGERYEIVGPCYVHGLMRGGGVWFPGAVSKSFELV